MVLGVSGPGRGPQRFRGTLLPALFAALLPACGAGGTVGPEEPEVVEWIPLTMATGDVVNIAVLRPSVSARGVVVAFPWGRGDSELVLSLLDSYWDQAAPAAGYAVVGVEVYGPGLATGAGNVMNAVLDWIDGNFEGAAGDIVMTGASAGGIGVFHAALAVPDRVSGIIAMPGRYTEEDSLAPLSGLPVWLMVGENDPGWVTGSEATAERLEEAGAKVTLDIVPGQGHVLIVAQDALVTWMNER